jgi:hypothetical protein
MCKLKGEKRVPSSAKLIKTKVIMGKKLDNRLECARKSL